MKKITLLLSLVVLLATFQFSSCSKKSDSPVEQIVELLDQATKKTENIKSVADLSNVQSILKSEDVWKIIQENSDYTLTKTDKEKLKKSYSKLMHAAFDKGCEYVNSEEMKKTVKAQVDILIEAVDRNIDRAETLGEIRAFS